jgi:hypothetical protein
MSAECRRADLTHVAFCSRSRHARSSQASRGRAAGRNPRSVGADDLSRRGRPDTARGPSRVKLASATSCVPVSFSRRSCCWKTKWTRWSRGCGMWISAATRCCRPPPAPSAKVGSVMSPQARAQMAHPLSLPGPLGSCPGNATPLGALRAAIREQVRLDI